MSFFGQHLCAALRRRREYRVHVALLKKVQKFMHRVAMATEQVFYHVFLTSKCFKVINFRWLLLLQFLSSIFCFSFE